MDWNFTDPSTHKRKLYVRPATDGYTEVQLTDGRVLGNGVRCVNHKLLVASATFAFDRDEAVQAQWLRVRGKAWKLGDDAFERTDHADGTHCGDPQDSMCWTERPCSGCGQYDSYKLIQHAWHDETFCTTPDCPNGQNNAEFRSIGD